MYGYSYSDYFIGSIEIQIATMKKADRAKTKEVYVRGFFPKHLLPSKMPWSLDPFLHPLIVEIEDSFINKLNKLSTTAL